ncbi:YrhB domain-containing protein [Kitasatospora sp. NPDC006697]|uniref:YrhB domain-containing protein n=1 Tax=Kitasatospora sp. NPDC006697 TaxID=3364020 RepID=UPI0036AFCECA
MLSEERERAGGAAEYGTARAAAWIRELYGSVVELVSAVPAAETGHGWLFACRAVPQPGYPRTPMLNASVVVPKSGAEPFHPATADPWGDLAALAERPAPTPPQWVHRTNAHGWVVAANARLDGALASAFPWRPPHEAPGWWGRLVRRYLPGAEVSRFGDWASALEHLRQGGPDSRAVVWVRRRAGGQEITGHLLLALLEEDRPVVLDPQAGGMARLEHDGVHSLTVARFRSARAPWTRHAPALPAAVAKAEAWLAHHHGDQAALIGPSEADDLGRGWLFACNSVRYLAGGDWREGMLEAAVVVPKDTTAPFALPTGRPWSYLDSWLAGTSGDPDDLPFPGPVAWLAALGPLVHTAAFADWPQARAALATMPDTPATVWLRRADARGRETVGRLLRSVPGPDGPQVLDPTRQDAPVAEPEPAGVFAVHVLWHG